MDPEVHEEGSKRSKLSSSATLSKSKLSSIGILSKSSCSKATLSNAGVDGATLSNAGPSKATLSSAGADKATLGSHKATLSGAAVDSAALHGGGNPGVGPPIQTKYKGELRSIHDGAGLCSPGRWPVGRRTAPSTELGKELARWCMKAFEDWVELVGEDRVKRLFWEMATGKLGGSPFGGEIYGFRERLDLWLKERGGSPERRSSDRRTEMNFRRLMAVAKVLGDEDAEFLAEVASRGVPLGVDEEMPRNPRVYEEKQKWTVEQTEDDFHDTMADNYVSAEENSDDIARQVLEEVEKGSILRFTEEEAKNKFGGRLAVAALGAVVKELGTTKVRLIHDGTYSVDVNRRIRVRDRSSTMRQQYCVR